METPHFLHENAVSGAVTTRDTFRTTTGRPRNGAAKDFVDPSIFLCGIGAGKVLL